MGGSRTDNARSWRDRIKAVASATEPPTPEGPLVQALEDFRDDLNESPWIRAELRVMGHPRRRTLFVFPKYRRDVSTMVLTFWLEQDMVRVYGSGEAFDDTEELGSFLADFVERSAFPGIVDEYRRLQAENVHGTLRVRGLREDDPGDVPVFVAAAEHNALAQKALAAVTEMPNGVGVVLEEHPRAGKFNPETRYLSLESGGFAVRLASDGVRRPDATGKELRLFGKVVPLGELPP